MYSAVLNVLDDTWLLLHFEFCNGQRPPQSINHVPLFTVHTHIISHQSHTRALFTVHTYNNPSSSPLHNTPTAHTIIIISSAPPIHPQTLNVSLPYNQIHTQTHIHTDTHTHIHTYTAETPIPPPLTEHANIFSSHKKIMSAPAVHDICPPQTPPHHQPPRAQNPEQPQSPITIHTHFHLSIPPLTSQRKPSLYLPPLQYIPSSTYTSTTSPRPHKTLDLPQ